MMRSLIAHDTSPGILSSLDVASWTPFRVKEWLVGLRDEPGWIDGEYIVNNDYNGQKLLTITVKDLEGMGAKKVDLQEQILDVIERLRFYNSNIHSETLQMAVLRLAVQSRSLQKQLVANRSQTHPTHSDTHNSKAIILSKEFANGNGKYEKQRVNLDTLISVSEIVETVKEIIQISSSAPFVKYDDYRAMKSLILALSIELTSTAQRDQFVDRPNDILEKSSKALADYCDRIVYGTGDVLLMEPFRIRTVRIRKSVHDKDFGMSIKSQVNGAHHIDRITPLSPAKKTNALHKGDEVVYFSQFVIGWSERNLQDLIQSCEGLSNVTIIVIKNPRCD